MRAFLRAVAGYQAQCHDCGVLPGEFHVHGCDEERCPLCHFQLIGCDCVYEVNGLGSVDLEEEHPDVYDNGPTEQMYAVFDAEVAKRGGYVRWKGESEGLAECRERGWWCRKEATNTVMGMRYVPCGPEHADAHEDLNRWGAFLRWGRDAREE